MQQFLTRLDYITLHLLRCHGRNTFLHVADPRIHASTRQTCSHSSVKSDVGHEARKENGKWYLFLFGLESQIFYSVWKDMTMPGNTLTKSTHKLNCKGTWNLRRRFSQSVSALLSRSLNLFEKAKRAGLPIMRVWQWRCPAKASHFKYYTECCVCRFLNSFSITQCFLAPLDIREVTEPMRT